MSRPARLRAGELGFPPAEFASPEGIVAFGGDVSPERLLLAYSSGIFPWPHEGYPLLWFSPDPRFLLDPHEAIVGRSLQKSIRRARYEIRFDTRFREVMRGCKRAYRPGQAGTWITESMIEGYGKLHDLGFAHSIEAYEDGELIGGLYGVSLGGAFFGESMFAERPDASKVAFATLLAHLLEWGFDFVDCQVHTEHLERFGAMEIPRSEFLAMLRESLSRASRRGPWERTLTPSEVLEALQSKRRM